MQRVVKSVSHLSGSFVAAAASQLHGLLQDLKDRGADILRRDDGDLFHIQQPMGFDKLCFSVAVRHVIQIDGVMTGQRSVEYSPQGIDVGPVVDLVVSLSCSFVA